MPLLAGFIGTLFTSLWGIVQAFLIARLALRVASVGVLYLAWVELKDLVDNAISVAWVSMPSIIAIPMTWIMPTNMPAIISLILTVESGLLAYRWAKILFNVQTSA